MLRPVHLDPALIGKPLPCDLFSESGVLLAGEGLLLEDAAHFHKLTSRPLYQRSEFSPEATPVLHLLSELAKHTMALFSNPQQGLNEEELRLSARAFVSLFHVDPDACLGYSRLAPVAPVSLNHSLQVLFIAVLLADLMEFSEAQVESLAAAALTMNIAYGPLFESLYNQIAFASNEDWVKERAHPGEAATLLEQANVTDQDWLDSVLQHHENIDGSGFPGNLSGAQITLAARILHVADVYCGKINSRFYRPPKTTRFAFTEFFGDERTHLDMQIATLLLREVGLLPPGTLVQLENRENACITRLGRQGRIRFAISFMNAHGRVFDPPKERNLETRAYAIRNLIDFDPAWPTINWNRLWGY